jgi:hypothetical protein
VGNKTIFSKEMDRIRSTFNVFLFDYVLYILIAHILIVVYKYIKETPTYVGVGPTRLL